MNLISSPPGLDTFLSPSCLTFIISQCNSRWRLRHNHLELTASLLDRYCLVNSQLHWIQRNTKTCQARIATMASLMICPDEIILKIMEYLLQNARYYFSHSRQSRTSIAYSTYRPIILRITAVNSRLRELSWSYLNRHGRFTAAYLDNLLHKCNEVTTFEHIECLSIILDQSKHFVRPDCHSPAPFLSSFPNLKQVSIWLRRNYPNPQAWPLHDGGSKAETFVRHIVSDTVGSRLAGLLLFLHSPNCAVDVVVEINCTHSRQSVSQVHFPLLQNAKSSRRSVERQSGTTRSKSRQVDVKLRMRLCGRKHGPKYSIFESKFATLRTPGMPLLVILSETQ